MRTFEQKPKTTQSTKAAKVSTVSRAYGWQGHDPNSILNLESTVGNRALRRLPQSDVQACNPILTGTISPHFGCDFSRIPVTSPNMGAIQTKLAISKPGDEYEQEADRIADAVMALRRTSAPSGRVLASEGVTVRSGDGGKRINRMPDEPVASERPLFAHPIKYRLWYDQENDRYEDLASTRLFTGEEMVEYAGRAERFAIHHAAVSRILERRISELDRVNDEIAEHARRGVPVPDELVKLRAKDVKKIVEEAHYEAGEQSVRLVTAGSTQPDIGCRIAVEPQENPLLDYPIWVHERTHELHCLAIVGRIKEKDRRDIESRRAVREGLGLPPVHMPALSELGLYHRADVEMSSKRVRLESEVYAYRAGAQAAQEEVQAYQAGETRYAPGVPVSFEEEIEVPTVRRAPNKRQGGVTKSPPDRLVRDIVAGGDGGQSLPAQEQRFLESALGHDFSKVRIHGGQRAWRAAEGLNARAFTIGSDIYFGKGEYAPQSETGRRLLVHELVHVLQHGGGAERPRSSLEVKRKVKPGKVSCTDYPSSHPVIRNIGTEDPVAAIDEAADSAVELLDHAIGTLRSAKSEYERALGEAGLSEAVPDEAERVASALYRVFGLDPTTPEALHYLWTEEGPQTVDVVIRRLEAAKVILDGGEMAYACLGEDCEPETAEPEVRHPGHEVLETIVIPPPPEGRRCISPMAYVTGAGYRIYLCKPWWNASPAERSSTLIHEALHIYFPDLLLDDGAPIVNPYSYEKLLRAIGRMGQE